jgi:hypothetical protein
VVTEVPTIIKWPPAKHRFRSSTPPNPSGVLGKKASRAVPRYGAPGDGMRLCWTPLGNSYRKSQVLCIQSTRAPNALDQ